MCPRKPGLFPISDDLAHLRGLWTDKHLTAAAGGAQLEVEQQRAVGEGFGKGHRIPLAFGEVLRRMAAGDASLYLTTQAVGMAADGHPKVYASPIAELAGDIPLVPHIMGKLVPQQINIWMGAAQDGSSTGLHTDFHDNLYVLLRGRKRFRLYPPQLAGKMYTMGKVERVHANGRIVFKGQGNVLPDGSDAGEAKQYLARHEAEQELAAAEAAVAEGQPGAAKRLKLAEDKLDAVLEAALGDDFDALDDFDAMEEAVPPPRPAAAGDPDSFCKVDLNLPDAQLKKKFPQFPGKAAALECIVEAGQMLYLPAGWFHEVTSYATDDCPTHLALNYWYHPPDNLKDASTVLEQPYTSAFWPAVWEGRRAEYEARHRQQAQSEAQQHSQEQEAVAKPAQKQGETGKGGSSKTEGGKAAAGKQSAGATRSKGKAAKKPQAAGSRKRNRG
ncbi:ion channel [Chlorella sorokiniana]|uniref:Ion channel n=1 Tax=Chlorella sorokiniana TaxID=3076 RepID=A0A2P6U3K9_CHLSO|nr:ion channel [Chlorella sorokiniana]|eukprot:PRW60895.1 ion channel [Chlorella sorokiniana]